MKIDLKGKRAVVTGSTAGIGRAIAEGLARAGAAVVINGRGEERVSATLRNIRALFPAADITGFSADLATAEGADDFAARAGDADILINNVGTAKPKAFLELADSDWQDLFELNVMSGVRMTRHHLPSMTKRGWGCVVFISSESAPAVPQEMIDYGMTKTAQLAISRGVAESVAGTGVTVSAVLPGPTNSKILSNWMKATAAAEGITQDEAEQNFLNTMRPTSLLKRFTTTDEIANMVVYLCSEQASGTTGAALRVDGGVLRQIA
ncbi:SDR family NAD(P)-dependent oxidoreductase [Lichenifustis flavocetrariae]|uniref:SDR family oxidoreductase n=1 Tax=Lichenifustis flavocetrariae TaxID=2949735 RepID=A0AA41Z298_9HYPH|nr:SDR family oxidoreductase [Lichenifustis flavocetrariae]MCW6511505.1 SDR family oxidoreductase [Lichenifustis flavocetrariae]